MDNVCVTVHLPGYINCWFNFCQELDNEERWAMPGRGYCLAWCNKEGFNANEMCECYLTHGMKNSTRIIFAATRALVSEISMGVKDTLNEIIEWMDEKEELTEDWYQRIDILEAALNCYSYDIPIKGLFELHKRQPVWVIAGEGMPLNIFDLALLEVGDDPPEFKVIGQSRKALHKAIKKYNERQYDRPAIEWDKDIPRRISVAGDLWVGELLTTRADYERCTAIMKNCTLRYYWVSERDTPIYLLRNELTGQYAQISFDLNPLDKGKRQLLCTIDDHENVPDQWINPLIQAWLKEHHRLLLD